MMNDYGTPHCWACGKEMSSDEILDHIKTCSASNALLFPVTALMLGARDPSHKASHLVFSATKYHHMIEEYARAIVEEIPSFERSRIHMRLCDRLGVEYSKFKPFERDDIWEIPSQEEAESIIWEEVGKIARAILDKGAGTSTRELEGDKR